MKGIGWIKVEYIDRDPVEFHYLYHVHHFVCKLFCPWSTLIWGLLSTSLDPYVQASRSAVTPIQSILSCFHPDHYCGARVSETASLESIRSLLFRNNWFLGVLRYTLKGQLALL